MKKAMLILFCLILTIGLFAGLPPASMASATAAKTADSAGAKTNTNKTDTNKADTNVVKGINRFAWDVFKELNGEDTDKNVFISPFSISTALTMVYEGAGTTTKKAMARTLHYDSVDTIKLNGSYKALLKQLMQSGGKTILNIGNSIWFKNGTKIKKSFLDTNKDVFAAHTAALDFTKKESADLINRWISDSTKGKIKKMVDYPIRRDIVMYLINAIYFKGEWASRFKANNTFKTDFNAESGKKESIMMMKREGSLEYGTGSGFTAVRLPYSDKKAAMYCILPDKGVPVNEFIAKLNLEYWKTITDSIRKRDDAILELPRFSMSYGIKELNKCLSDLGMGEAFGDASDFSGIVGKDDPAICISRVLHKAVIDVNEKGSEAAGATSVEMKLTALAPSVSFIADRPFVFVIADEKTGTILFMGKMRDMGL